jgi:hypothetical protein
MIILSLNMRGVGGSHKNIILKIVFGKYKHDIILIQETMSEGGEMEILSFVLKD